jgi:hypothetical protein
VEDDAENVSTADDERKTTADDVPRLTLSELPLPMIYTELHSCANAENGCCLAGASSPLYSRKVLPRRCADDTPVLLMLLPKAAAAEL